MRNIIKKNEEEKFMITNALIMHETDNVAVCITPVSMGDSVLCKKSDNGIMQLTAEEAIPAWHKMALTVIEKGDHIIKYGEVIGKATQKIEKGKWVSHQNIEGIPRDYDSEIIK